jgi:hypothetical protein
MEVIAPYHSWVQLQSVVELELLAQALNKVVALVADQILAALLAQQVLQGKAI